jgi:hypothetical protein
MTHQFLFHLHTLPVGHFRVCRAKAFRRSGFHEGHPAISHWQGATCCEDVDAKERFPHLYYGCESPLKRKLNRESPVMNEWSNGAGHYDYLSVAKAG